MSAKCRYLTGLGRPSPRPRHPVQGTVGDSDPSAAVQQAVEGDGFDEITISTLTARASHRLLRHLPQRARRLAGPSLRSPPSSPSAPSPTLAEPAPSAAGVHPTPDWPTPPRFRPSARRVATSAREKRKRSTHRPWRRRVALADEHRHRRERYILGGSNFTFDRPFADLGRIGGVEPPLKVARRVAAGPASVLRIGPAPTTLSPQEGPRREQFWPYRPTKARRDLGWKARSHEERSRPR